MCQKLSSSSYKFDSFKVSSRIGKSTRREGSLKFGETMFGMTRQILLRCFVAFLLFATCLLDDSRNGFALAMPQNITGSSDENHTTISADLPHKSTTIRSVESVVPTASFQEIPSKFVSPASQTYDTNVTGDSRQNLTEISASMSSSAQLVDSTAPESLDYNTNGANGTMTSEDDSGNVTSSGSNIGDEDDAETATENDNEGTNRGDQLYGDESYLDTYDDTEDREDVDLEKDEEDDI